MDTNLADQIATELSNERSDALLTYRCLIAAPEPTSKDRARLRDAMRVLGKSPDDLRKEVQALNRIVALRQEIERADSSENEEKLRQAKIAREEFMEETRQLIDVRNAEFIKLRLAVEEIERDRGANHVRSGELRRLEHLHWELLGLPKPEVKFP